jgi:hypothetical protein
LNTIRSLQQVLYDRDLAVEVDRHVIDRSRELRFGRQPRDEAGQGGHDLRLREPPDPAPLAHHDDRIARGALHELRPVRPGAVEPVLEQLPELLVEMRLRTSWHRL